MSVSAISNQTTFLDTLASAASTAAQMQSKISLDLINSQIQKNLQQQIAALQNAPDDAVVGVLQTQIAALQKQANAASTIGAQFGGNVDTLADLQDQLGAMQTAAAGGDGSSFDAALAAAQLDLGDLVVVTPTAPYQPDQIDALQANGLGISDSAAYDLSSPTGQAAAAADVTAAQDLIGQIVQATTSNQVLAGSIATALTTQVNGLTTTLSNLQKTNQLDITTKILQLTQQAQNQSHLIQLALGNTQLLATSLSQALNPPQPYGTPLDALQGAADAAAAPSGTTTQTAPAVLSLLA